MNWLRRIFSRKSKEKENFSVEEVEVNIRNLSNWLDEKTSDITEQLKSNYLKIKEISEQINEKAEALGKVDLSERKVEERIKKIVESNRDAYVMNVNTFIKNTKVPEKASYAEAFAFYSLTTPRLNKIGKKSLRNIALTTQLIGKECVAVTKSLQALGKLVKELKNILSSERAKSAHQAKKSAKELMSLLEARNKLQEDKKGLVLEKESLETKSVEVKRGIDKLKSSKEYKEFQFLSFEKKRIWQQVGEIDFRIRNLFGSLQKPMYKFLQMNKDPAIEGILKEYLKDSAAALSKDKELKILGLLREMEGLVLEGKIGLKDKKKKHTLRVLKEIDAKRLRELTEKKSLLEESDKKLRGRISEIDVAKKIEESVKELIDIDFAKQEIQKKLEKLKGREEKLTFEKLEAEIVGKVKDATKTTIKLTYS